MSIPSACARARRFRVAYRAGGVLAVVILTSCADEPAGPPPGVVWVGHAMVTGSVLSPDASPVPGIAVRVALVTGDGFTRYTADRTVSHADGTFTLTIKRDAGAANRQPVPTYVTVTVFATSADGVRVADRVTVRFGPIGDPAPVADLYLVMP